MPERTVFHGGILLLMLVMVMQIGLLLLPSQLHTVKSTKSCHVITHLCRSRWFLADLAEPFRMIQQLPRVFKVPSVHTAADLAAL